VPLALPLFDTKVKINLAYLQYYRRNTIKLCLYNIKYIWFCWSYPLK